MISIARPPLTFDHWSPPPSSVEDTDVWPLFNNISDKFAGTFGTLPSPYTVPNHLWLAASSEDEDTSDKAKRTTSDDQKYVVIENGQSTNSFRMVIEYIYLEPSLPVVKSNKYWFDNILTRLGILNKNKHNSPVEEEKDPSWEIDYQDLKEMQYLDCGAQGFVYLAKLNDELVAVKKMRQKCSTNDFRHLRKLNHRNVVAFKGACMADDSDCCCLVMEFCPFGQLGTYLANTPSLTPTRLADWMHQIASGMAYLHSQSICHRDLKSPNLLVSHQNVLKICDFDTSRQLSSGHKRQMSMAGTVSWMAPEFIRNEPCSEKIDIWSYSVVVWELCTLEVPYCNFEPFAVMFGVGNGTLTLPLPDSIPATLRELMQRCWNPDPAARPSFQDILFYLDNILPQLKQIKPSEFHQMQCRWKHEVQSSQSRSRASLHSSCAPSSAGSSHSKFSTNSIRSHLSSSANNNKIHYSAISINNSTKRKRKHESFHSNETHHFDDDDDENIENVHPSKRMRQQKAERVKPCKQAQVTKQSRSKAFNYGEHNLFKYLYLCIVRNCK